MNPFNLKQPMHINSDVQNQVQATMDCVHSGHRLKDEAFIFCKKKGSPGKNETKQNKSNSKFMERKLTNRHGFK